MKIIVSHDIDHITVSEHFNDAILPKFIARSFIELSKGMISINEIVFRLNNIIRNKWQNIDEIINFNKQQNIPSTFFIGVNNGLGLKYNKQLALLWIEKIIAKGFDIGVHGIDYDNLEGISKEFNTFKSLSKQNSFGIRMHYLRNNQKTMNMLSDAGYLFDTTEYSIKNPYKVNKMWEFPLHIMDGYEIEAGKAWQSLKLHAVKENTLKKIDIAFNKNIEYLTVLFHDRYYDKSFSTWINWYDWIIRYFAQNNFEFISYKDAIKELENKNNIEI